MTFPSRGGAPKRSLLEDTERLVHKLVRQTGRARSVTGPDGKRKSLPPDPSDMARAVEASLKFQTIKAKLDPEETTSEFQLALERYHGKGGGDAPDAEDGPGTKGGHPTAH